MKVEETLFSSAFTVKIERRIFMKVINIVDVNKFFEEVRKCEGRVELVTEQGDCINLSTTISQLVAAVKIVTEKHIQQGDIISHNIKDTERLLKQMKNR